MSSVKSNLKIPSCAQNVPEVQPPREIKFTAPIPGWLKGTLWTSGPGTFDLEKGSYKNWLDGLAMITKVEIGSESVKLSSKHVHTVNYKKAVKAKHPVIPGLMTPPGDDNAKGFFSKFMPFGPNDISDNCIGVVTNIDSKMYVMADGPTIYEINQKNLSTVGHFNSHKIFGLNNICPEVIKDVTTGDLYVCGSTLKATFQNTIVKMPFSHKSKRLEEATLVGSIPSRWKFGPCCLRKCFALTENYIIFIETPHIVNVVKVAATYIKGYRMYDWMDWVPADKTRIYLMQKTTGKVLKVEYLTAQAILLLDIVNAYEENNKIILDVCTQSNMSLFDGFNLSNIRSLISPKNYVPGCMERFVIPIIADVRKHAENSSLLSSDVNSLAIRKGDRVILTGEPLGQNCNGYDTGCINPNYSSRKHLFTYTTCCLPSTVFRPTSPLAHGVGKVNLGDAGYSQVMWEAGPGCHPWSPVFVPNPAPESKEDDGVLICFVTNLHKRQSDFLVVIDASTMKEISRVEFKDCPVASYYLATFYANNE